MERIYTDNGFISKGMTLNTLGTDGKFSLLIPVAEMPETASAPATADKTVLSDGKHTFAEGLQSNDQKTYTFNYHRDNLNILKAVAGKPLTFLERNPDNTGEKFKGTLSFSRNSVSADGIVQGSLYITVSDADELPISDVRDVMKPTAVITSPLQDIELTGTQSTVVVIETSPSATVSATSSSTSIATATYNNGNLTIAGVAKGNAMITLVTSATGEASSTRTIAVTVN